MIFLKTISAFLFCEFRLFDEFFVSTIKYQTTWFCQFKTLFISGSPSCLFVSKIFFTSTGRISKFGNQFVLLCIKLLGILCPSVASIIFSFRDQFIIAFH